MADFIFNSFAKVSTDGVVLESDITVATIMTLFNVNDPAVATSRDWEGYERVYYAAPPEASRFYRVDKTTPTRKDGKLFITWAVIPFTPAEIQGVIDRAKESINDSINAKRLENNYKSFTFMGKEIACDALSRSDIDGMQGVVQMLGALPPGWIGFWKTVDNGVVSIRTKAEWDSFYLAMYSKGIVHFSHAQYLKQKLQQAVTYEETVAISWFTPSPYLSNPT